MAFRIYLFLTIAFSYHTSAQTSYNPDKEISVSLLKSDFKLLRMKLEAVHPALYRYTPKAKMDVFFDSLNQSIRNPLSEQAFLSLIQLLSEKIKDGHTMFLPGKDFSEFNRSQGMFFPFSTRWIENKLIITENLSTNQNIYAGTEIISIDGTLAKDLLSDIMHRQIRDGYSLAYPYWILSKYFPVYYSLTFGHRSTFTVVLKTGTLETQTAVDALSIPDMQANQRVRYKHLPTALGIQMKETGSLSTAMITVGSFDPGDFEIAGQSDYKKTIHNIFLKLKENHINHLILDLRNNQGGEFEPVRVLLSYLIEKPCKFLFGGPESRWVRPNINHFSKRISILMNGGSFSGTSILIATLQREHRVVLIGEETGGNRVEISGDANLFVLPSTNLQCWISTKNYRILPGNNDGHGVFPDYLIQPTIHDLVSGKDSALSFAMSLPK